MQMGCVFTFVSGKTLTFEYSSGSLLPIANALSKPVLTPSGFYNTTNWAGASTGKLNISKAQEELLLWHGILGHYDISATQSLMTRGR